MSDEFWILLLTGLSLGLLIVNFFRTNVFIALAGIMVNIGLAVYPMADKPKWIFYAAILLSLAELFTLVTRVLFSKKGGKKRYTG